MRIYIPGILGLILISLFSGCNKRPKGVLSDADMVQLITDMEIAEIYIQDHSETMYNDSMRDKTVEWILKKRGIDKAQFDSTMTWYGKNIDIYRDLYAKVDTELAKRQRKATGEDVSASSNIGMDLWPYSRHIVLSDIANTQSLTFSVPPEKIEKGDRLNLNMRTTGMMSGCAMLGVDYEDGGSVYSYSNQNGNNKVELSLQLDTARIVKRIFGYLRAKDSGSAPIWIDSIALQRMPYDSTQYFRIYSQRKYAGPMKREEIKKDSVVVDQQDAEQKRSLDAGDREEEDKPLKPRKLPRADHKILDKSPLIQATPQKLDKSK